MIMTHNNLSILIRILEHGNTGRPHDYFALISVRSIHDPHHCPAMLAKR